jgi:hypothetical protein
MRDDPALKNVDELRWKQRATRDQIEIRSLLEKRVAPPG